ncbi:helix-turn-helix domain-containing protein [Kitasatospora sp. NPDC058263]
MTSDRPVGRIQSVRNAWINALRDETLRVRTPEMARVAHVGHMIATYADADGGGAFPSQDTLAGLVGGTDESVSRAVKVLIAVGVLEKKRRPNAPAVYRLLMPTGQKLDWLSHMHLYTDTRQKRARQAQKERAARELAGVRTPSQDGFRTPSQAGVPDTVPGGGSGHRPRTASEDSDTVLGRPRTPSQDRFRTPSQAGGTSTPTSGRDPLQDHTVPEPEPQPQVRAGARGETDRSPDNPQPNFARCSVCGDPMVPRPGRDAHAHCANARNAA